MEAEHLSREVKSETYPVGQEGNVSMETGRKRVHGKYICCIDKNAFRDVQKRGMCPGASRKTCRKKQVETWSCDYCEVKNVFSEVENRTSTMRGEEGIGTYSWTMR